MGGTVPVVGDKPVFAVEFLSFRLAVMSSDNGYRVGRVEVGKFGEEQFAAELAANCIFYRDGAGLPACAFVVAGRSAGCGLWAAEGVACSSAVAFPGREPQLQNTSGSNIILYFIRSEAVGISIGGRPRGSLRG